LCSGNPSDFQIPNIGAHRVSAEKLLTMPPQKKSKKNAPTKIDREEHHHDEDNGISHTPEPSNITDQEGTTKLEVLQKAKVEKTAHTLEHLAEQDTHENDDDNDDDDAVDREIERVQQKIQQLQKEKEKFANQLQAKRKASEKLEKLNQAKEQIKIIQIEIREMKEQENGSLWQDSPHQNSGQYRGIPKENLFAGNGISQFVDPESPLSIGLQTAPWPPMLKPVSLPKYNGFGNSRQLKDRYGEPERVGGVNGSR
jgi:predicted ribosome quality control (RQC) complex YloA/Tae2 family protein